MRSDQDIKPHLPAPPPETRGKRNEYIDLWWVDNASLHHAWKHDETGVPLVETDKREFWSTGWRHNELRMVAASARA